MSGGRQALIAADIVGPPYYQNRGRIGPWNTQQRGDNGATAWLTAGAASSLPGADNDWTNPTNILSDDGSYAESNDPTNGLQGSSFGASLPTGSRVTGVEVRFQAKVNSPGSPRLDVSLYTPSTSQSKSQTLTGSEAEYTLGGPNDLWGLSGITEADAEASGFGVRLYGTGGTGGETYSVDVVQVRFYYEVPEVWYVIGVDANSTPQQAYMYRSLDGGLTWSALDSANGPQLQGARTQIDAEYSSATGLVYVAYVDSTDTTNISYKTFTLSTGVWSSRTSVTTTRQHGGGVQCPTVTRSTTGPTLYIVYDGPVERVMGTDYDRCYRIYNSSGSWTGATAYGAGNQQHYRHGTSVAHPSTGRVHVIISSQANPGSSLWGQTDTTGWTTTQSDGVSIDNPTVQGRWGHLEPVVMGGTSYVVWPGHRATDGGQLCVIRGTSVAQPVTIDTNLATGLYNADLAHAPDIDVDPANSSGLIFTYFVLEGSTYRLMRARPTAFSGTWPAGRPVSASANVFNLGSHTGGRFGVSIDGKTMIVVTAESDTTPRDFVAHIYRLAEVAPPPRRRDLLARL